MTNLLLQRFSEIYFSRRRWVLLTEAKFVDNTYHFDLLISDKGDLLEQIDLRLHDFKLLSIYTPAKHRFRVGHRKIYGVAFKEKNGFDSPLFLGILRRRVITRAMPDLCAGDRIEIDDIDAHFFSRYQKWQLPGGKLNGTIVGVRDEEIHVQVDDGPIYNVNLDPEALAINGFYNNATNRNITVTLEKGYAASIAQPFHVICKILQRFGIFSFNRLRYCPPEQPSLKRYNSLFECVLELKLKSAQYFREVNLIPKAIFNVTKF